jgi:hypothetical protein
MDDIAGADRAMMVTIAALRITSFLIGSKKQNGEVMSPWDLVVSGLAFAAAGWVAALLKLR